MPSRILRRAGRYLAAIVAMGLTTGTLFSLRSWLNTSSVALLYLLPVGLSTALWGLGPGLVSALLAFIGLNYLFLPPYFTLDVINPDNLVALLLFLVVAAVISQLLGRAHANLSQARDREHEAIHLSKMSNALVGLVDARTIASSLAEEVLSALSADVVEVNLHPEPGGRPERLVLPPSVAYPKVRPTKVVPIQGVHGLLGEIVLWRTQSYVSDGEDRLLAGLSSVAALALERALLAQADSKARILEQSDALKSALLSSVSHELRTPLATIKASVTSLRSGEFALDAEARRELLAAIEEETDHLNHLVGNLLDMSRIEAGALRPQRSWNLLSEVLSSVLQRMRGDTQNHRILVDLPEELPLVPLDYVQIEQVFTNLISNSVKYSPPGTTIRVSASVSDDNAVLVQVANQGPHVPAEHLDRIFDKFFRLRREQSVTGTGLGLSICKGIVQAHGGRIWAENQPDGLAFRFTLPLTMAGFPAAPAGQT